MAFTEKQLIEQVADWNNKHDRLPPLENDTYDTGALVEMLADALAIIRTITEDRDTYKHALKDFLGNDVEKYVNRIHR